VEMVSASGYKVEVTREPFLASGKLLEKLTVRNGFPKIDVRLRASAGCHLSALRGDRSDL
jgi:hypothetical protein